MENWAWGGGRIAGKSKNAQKSIIWPGTWPNIFFWGGGALTALPPSALPVDTLV